MSNSKKELRKVLTETIENSPLWWWVRPFYDSPLFAPGYRVTFRYQGIPDDLESCAEAFKNDAIEKIESLTDEQFNNHPVLDFSFPGMIYYLYIGGPGSEPCCK